MKNLHIYSNFHPSEHSFVDKAWEWICLAAQSHVVKVTDFLDPRQCFILTSLVNRESDASLYLDGGYAEAERKRAVIAPKYMKDAAAKLSIQVISITSSDAGIRHLDHGDYLGALLNLGVKREKMGDLHVSQQGCHCLVAGEMIHYISLQVQQISRVHVQTEILPIDQLQIASANVQEMTISVASMRLDGIASDVHKLSRAKIMIPIRAGKCRVNWKQEEDPSKVLNGGDIVSIQGLGRFKINEIDGMTKKGRIRVSVSKYV